MVTESQKWSVVNATGGITFVEKVKNKRYKSFALRFDDGEAYRLAETLNDYEAKIAKLESTISKLKAKAKWSQKILSA